MITERQVALDLGMRLRLAGVDYPERESEWEYYDTGDIEVAQGRNRIYRGENGWNVERRDSSGAVITYNWGNEYGKAMDMMVRLLLEEFGHAHT